MTSNSRFLKVWLYKIIILEAFRAAIETFKQIDIVINNAGVATEDNYENMIAVNFVSTS